MPPSEPRDVKLFISYKTDTADPKTSSGLSQAAHMIRRILEARRFDVWMDVMRIQTGENWAQAVFDGLQNSDIVLLLISDKSEVSTGQQSEIEDARRLQKPILPIYIRGNFDQVAVMEQKFKLVERQMLDFRIGDDDQVNKLLNAISAVASEISLAVPSPIAKRKSYDEINPAQEKYATYKLDNIKCNIHLAVGNVMEMKDIDVFVNTENAYLQMARIFESNTISALLRYGGSHIRRNNQQLAQDTVQEELNSVIAQSRDLDTEDDITLPAPFGTVLVTSAGHPRSNLRKVETPRYIFHTVAVQVRGTDTDKRMDPARDGEIKQCTVNTLEAVSNVNSLKGVISPPGTGTDTKSGVTSSERERQEEIRDSGNYNAITSIILPLFASGHAGILESEVEEQVMNPICAGIKQFLQRNQGNTTLTDIHICIYGSKQLPVMERVMLKYFKLVMPPQNPIH